ncbi:hypothetical protein RQN30_10230 [Arcanobacterium hippocoleae]
MIAYEALTDSGIAWLGENKYSVTLQLSDINYSLAPSQVQEELIEKYAQFINSHLAGTHVQISIINRVLDKDEIVRGVQLGLRGDGFDSFRKDYNSLIAKRLSSGRNNTRTDKFLTLTVESAQFEEAKARLFLWLLRLGLCCGKLAGVRHKFLMGRLALMCFLIFCVLVLGRGLILKTCLARKCLLKILLLR